MLAIQTLIKSDTKGYFPSELIMYQLYNSKLGIDFPGKSFNSICLADLKYEELPCVYSFSEGVKWDNELRTYTERKLTLCFGNM